MLSRMILSVATLAFLTVGVIADDEGKDKYDNERHSTPTLENGDVNGDGERNITDAVRLLNYLFSAHEGPVRAMGPVGSSTYIPTEIENGDIDGSGRINVSDAVRFLNWLFVGEYAPVALGCDK